MQSLQLNFTAVIAAAALGFPLGFVWYGPLFGKVWMAETGITPERGAAANRARLFGTVAVLNLIAATSLAMFVGAGDWKFGTFAGFMTGLTFVSVGLGINYLFEFRSLRLWCINAGYLTVFFTAMGALIGAWH